MSLLMPTVFVVDPDASVRAALEPLLRRSGWKVRTFGFATEFLACARPSGPSCLVLEVNLPDHDPFELLRRIGAERPETPVIAISGSGDIPLIVRAMKAGAAEFLTKPLAEEALVPAVANALGSSLRVLEHEAQLRELRGRHDSLSGREREVMGRVVAGLLNKQVAASLGISEITVKAHRGKVMRKMGADSLPQLVRMALRLRLTPEPGIWPAAFSFSSGRGSLAGIAQPALVDV
jgi:FixJ family two-component response regulator